MIDKPGAREPGHLFQGTRLLEEVGSAGNDGELLLALHTLERALIELEHLPVLTAHNQ